MLIEAIPGALIASGNPLSLPAVSSSTCALPVSNLKLPLDPANYPNIRFWTRSAYDTFMNPKSSVATIGSKRSATDTLENVSSNSNDENLLKSVQDNELSVLPATDIPPNLKEGKSAGSRTKLIFLEDFDGQPVLEKDAREMNRTARSIWWGFYHRGLAPAKWGQLGQSDLDEYFTKMCSQYPQLALCENNWKANQLASLAYPSWYRYNIKEKSRGIKEELTQVAEPNLSASMVEIAATSEPQSNAPTVQPRKRVKISRNVPTNASDIQSVPITCQPENNPSASSTSLPSISVIPSTPESLHSASESLSSSMHLGYSDMASTRSLVGPSEEHLSIGVTTGPTTPLPSRPASLKPTEGTVTAHSLSMPSSGNTQEHPSDSDHIETDSRVRDTDVEAQCDSFQPSINSSNAKGKRRLEVSEYITPSHVPSG